MLSMIIEDHLFVRYRIDSELNIKLDSTRYDDEKTVIQVFFIDPKNTILNPQFTI